MRIYIIFFILQWCMFTIIFMENNVNSAYDDDNEDDVNSSTAKSF